MRTFIAINLPYNIKEAMGGLQNKLKAFGGEVNWVEPKNIHLTLKFLGEISKDALPEIINSVEAIANKTNQFKIKLSSCGVFPKLSFPKIIWVGISAGANQVKTVAEEIENKIFELNIPKDMRTFSSHITIGRTKSQQNREKLVQGLIELANYFEKEDLEFDVKKITLFKSTLKPDGPIYEVLKEVNLKTT